MNRYTETREASGELLRMILPLLSRQSAEFHPISYALWHEYAAGIDPQLNKLVDARFAGGKPLEDLTVSRPHEKHIAKRDGAVSTKLRSELERMLQDLSKTAGATGERTREFSKSLDGLGA